MQNKNSKLKPLKGMFYRGKYFRLHQNNLKSDRDENKTEVYLQCPLAEKDLYAQDGMAEDSVECLQEALILPSHDMDSEDEEFWIWDGMVRGLDGIGRFVLGLEDNVEVMEGDELIEYLKQRAEQILDTY